MIKKIRMFLGFIKFSESLQYKLLEESYERCRNAIDEVLNDYNYEKKRNNDN